MAIALLRSQITANFRNQIKHHHFYNNSKQIGSQISHNSNHNQLQQLLQQQQHAKHYSRFSNFFKKSAKDVEIPTPPFLYGAAVSSSNKSSILSKFGFVGWYLGSIKSRPVLTKSVTSSLIYIAADLTSQTIAMQSSESYDFIRTLRMAGYGGVVLGPALHYWFNFMSKILPGTGLLTTVKKMILGQTVFGPTMTVFFFSMNAAVQGEDAMEIFVRLKRDLLPTMLNGAMYWPICDFITFKFVPVHLQPLVSNSFSYLWTIYLTYMASLEKPTVA